MAQAAQGIEHALPDLETRTRRLTGPAKIVAALWVTGGTLSAVLYVFHIVFGNVAIEDIGFFALTLGMFFPLVFLYYPVTKGSNLKVVPWYDFLFALLSFLGPLYIFLNAYNLRVDSWAFMAPPLGIALGMITWVLVLEGMRRTTGWVLTTLTFLFTIYPLFAGVLPGILQGKSYSLVRTASFHFASTESMWGLPAGAFAKLFIGFILMGVVLQCTGGGTFFLNLALSVIGRLRGGSAKASVLGSGLFGMLSGSSFANTITTGMITIPAMKKSGYPNYYAGAVEAVASTGGMIMPPVMTFTAFIMADFLGMSYASVCLAAAIPAFLYYFALLTQADFFAAKTGIKGMSGPDLPSAAVTFREGWFYLVVLFALIYFLLWLQLEGQAPFYATLLVLILTNLRRETRLNGKRIGDIFQSSGEVLSMLAVVIVGVGMLIGGAILTGLAHSFAASIGSMVGNNLILLLFVTAGIAYVLGMGITITPIYIFMAILIAPALVSFGVYPMAAHMFILYWALVAEISPPVALTALVASSIAKAGYMKTALQAVRLGMVAIFVPFLFVFNPALLMSGTALQIGEAVATAVLAIISLSVALEAYLPFVGKIPNFMRPVFLVAGGLLFVPRFDADALGVAIIIAGAIVCAVAKRAAARKLRGVITT